MVTFYSQLFLSTVFHFLCFSLRLFFEIKQFLDTNLHYTVIIK